VSSGYSLSRVTRRPFTWRVFPILYFIFNGILVDPRLRASNSTFLSCAFREQEDDLVALPLFLRIPPITLSSQDTGFLDSRTIHWVKKRVEVALGQGVLYTLLRLLLRGCWTMRRPDDNAEDARIADNLRRTIELTEFGLALRQSVVQQDTLIGNMAQVMREIRRAKEQAWQQSPS